MLWICLCLKETSANRAQPRGWFARKSLPKLVSFCLFWAEGEVKMYSTYRETENLDQNFSLKFWKLLPVWEVLAEPCPSDASDHDSLFFALNMSYLMTKPTEWLCAQQGLRSACVAAQSDQSSLCAQWVAKDPCFLHADNEDSDQTGWMPRLNWVFAGCTCHFVGFVMSWLNYGDLCTKKKQQQSIK